MPRVRQCPSSDRRKPVSENSKSRPYCRSPLGRSSQAEADAPVGCGCGDRDRDPSTRSRTPHSRAQTAHEWGRPGARRDSQLEAAGAGDDAGRRGGQGAGHGAGGRAGKIQWGFSGPVRRGSPPRSRKHRPGGRWTAAPYAAGFTHRWACSLWQVSDCRVHAWRARRDIGALIDEAAGGRPVHALPAPRGGHDPRRHRALSGTWTTVASQAGPWRASPRRLVRVSP